jgi:hypothetical protein
MPVLEKKRQGWKIDLLAACKWRFAPKDASTSSEEFDPDALAPKQRLEWYQGTKARIELELRQGQLVEAADAEQQMSVIIKSFVNFLETFVDILERDTGLTGAQVERAIELVDAQRESLSKTLKEAASAG